MSKQDLLTIDLNLTEVNRMLGGLAEAGKDTSPLMRKIAGTMAAMTALNFQDEGNPPWEPSLAAQERSGKTLSASGHLRRSITEKYDAGHAMVGTNVEYGVTHQLGLTLVHKSRPSKDKRKPGMMTKAWKQAFPARPFLPVDANGKPQKGLEEKILTLATDFLREAANGPG
ncbi:phage virion morphogenesis protein [Salmonella enterica]|uniref:Phage virion morphogenesis protein n=1 Tax=Salmonella enterica TaxID=28901 RepID=A0A629K756_SALER|nr:phage virion morphogenesis protein [Salmonella enterica]EDF8918431.1 phage virion morphogenesis protein [Salmonella enterica]EGG8606525.1 phage virion morphogenesis protein [Salmonella enterica]EGR6192249.1 phage virion morphogenesis protein [Salmonella enterica]EHR7427384.1 phage virion morphogenesis protein [Salmonella enterica]